MHFANEMGQPWCHGWPVFAAEGDVLTVIHAEHDDAPQAYALPLALPRAIDEGMLTQII